MTSDTLVSVIIPAYNRASFLPETLRSVFAQTDKRMEIILVDDGSTDETADVALSHQKHLHYVRQENKGVAAARNHGLRLSRGAWVTFIDSDDLWTEDKIEKDLKASEKSPQAHVLYSGTRLLRSNGIGPPVLPSIDSSRFLEEIAIRNTLSMGAVTVRRECLDSVRGFNEERLLGPSADWELWVRLAARYQFAPTGTASLIKREHPSNMMHDPKGMERSMTLAMQCFLADVEAGPKLRHTKDRIHSHMLLTAAITYYGCGDTRVARDRLNQALRVHAGVIWDPMWGYTLIRSFLGSRATHTIRQWKNRFIDTDNVSYRNSE